MASGGKRSAGERVLEGRHVIGLFILMLLFSAVFFTLGYVMGRNQSDGVHAATTLHSTPDSALLSNPDPTAKYSSNSPATPDSTAPSSDWEFYSADKQKQTEGTDHLKPVSPSTVPTGAKTGTQSNANTNGHSSAPDDSPKAAQFSGGYMLQVSAVRRESDALDLARRLQKKKFPAFVLSPQGNKFYRVQVGPYGDQKSAEAAKRGLENAGFRAIVKRG
jgi:cell division septation protein DedD